MPDMCYPEKPLHKIPYTQSLLYPKHQKRRFMILYHTIFKIIFYIICKKRIIIQQICFRNTSIYKGKFFCGKRCFPIIIIYSCHLLHRNTQHFLGTPIFCIQKQYKASANYKIRKHCRTAQKKICCYALCHR